MNFNHRSFPMRNTAKKLKLQLTITNTSFDSLSNIQLVDGFHFGPLAFQTIQFFLQSYTTVPQQTVISHFGLLFVRIRKL